MDEADVDSYFYHNFLAISHSHHRIVRVSKRSNKKSFAFELFHFCDSKLQQRFNLKEGGRVSKKQIPLPKPKSEIGYTKATDELFSHCYKDIVEHLNRQNRSSFRFGKNKTCIFSIKKFDPYGDRFILTEIVNLGYREIKHLYKNWFFIAYKCDIFGSNYDIWRQYSRNYWRCVLHQRDLQQGEMRIRERTSIQSDTLYVFKKCKAWTLAQTFPFLEQEQFPTNHSHSHQETLKWVEIWNKRIRFLLADDLSNIFTYQIILFNFNLLSVSQI